MKKIIMVVSLAALLTSPAFAQAPAGAYGTGNIIFPGDPAAAAAAGAYGTSNIIFPNNPSAAAAAGAYGTGTTGSFLGVPSGAAGAFAYEPKPEPSTRQECAQQFKSYDSRSGTYLGRDGYRHSCP